MVSGKTTVRFGLKLVLFGRFYLQFEIYLVLFPNDFYQLLFWFCLVFTNIICLSQVVVILVTLTILSFGAWGATGMR